MLAYAPTIKTILQKYMLEPHVPVTPATSLRDLEIDCLDLPMIFLDIEDAFDVQVACAIETDQNLTFGGLVDCVAISIAAKRDAASAPRARRPKRTWVSTAADSDR